MFPRTKIANFSLSFAPIAWRFPPAHACRSIKSWISYHPISSLFKQFHSPSFLNEITDLVVQRTIDSISPTMLPAVVVFTTRKTSQNRPNPSQRPSPD